MFSTKDNLDWDVVTRDLTYMVDGSTYTVPFKKAHVRTDTNQCVGVTGLQYNVFQNSSLKELIMPSVEEGLLEIVNIGYLGVGQRVFLQAQMAEEFTIAGEQHKGMISLLNAHDGTAALAAGVTSTRVICQNTFSQAMTDMESRLRHGKNLESDASQITAIINYVNEGMAEYSKAVEQLASTKCSVGTVDELIETVFNKPVESVKAANTIKAFYRSGKGNEGKTLYDAVNGFTEYFTHAQGKDDDKRFVSTNFGRNATLSRKAFRSALAMVCVTYDT